MTESGEIQNVIDAAMYFAERGFRVFPVVPWKGTGERNDGKLPAIKEWQNTATTNLDQIVRWFATDYRGYNFGIAADKLVILDVDTLEHSGGAKDGPAELARLEAENSKIPATFRWRCAPIHSKSR